MMMIKQILGAAILGSTLFSGIAAASTASFSEPALHVRFEQYTAGTLVLWRMPSPGVSTFPNGSCVNLVVPGATVITNRFMALYLFAKTQGLNYFVYYDTSNCTVLSFGLDG